MKIIFLILILFSHNISAKILIETDSKFRYLNSLERGISNQVLIKNQFRVALVPKPNLKPTAIDKSFFGVALNGVLLDTTSVEFWQKNHSFDRNRENMKNSSNIGVSRSLAKQDISTLTKDKFWHDSEKLIGYAADGFPIYNNDSLKSAWRLKSGNRPANYPAGKYDGTYDYDFEFAEKSGNLGRCNSYFGKTREYPNGTYFYVITEDFPFIPRCFIGNADDSFKKKESGAGRLQKPSFFPKNQDSMPKLKRRTCLVALGNSLCISSAKEGENSPEQCRENKTLISCAPQGLLQ
ncbi:MAG: hypothetical protein ACI9TO_000674 [Rickettsiales bacterium]|jgi:hypothetical protein